jgi:hypothetical protein
MHIYAFGSVCRGEVSPGSDVDLLAIVDGYDSKFDPDTYSVYSYKRIEDLWREGNPFAWHLSIESRLLFSPDGQDLIQSLRSPAPYKNCVRDCEKFLSIFRDARASAATNRASRVFDISTVFLSVRNIATCFSLGATARPNFSRNSAICLGEDSIPIPYDEYHILERARVLCTRGYGAKITDQEVAAAILHFGEIHEWMRHLVKKAKQNARIQ